MGLAEQELDDRMAHVELLDFDEPALRDASPDRREETIREKCPDPRGGQRSAPRTETRRAAPPERQRETSFSRQHGQEDGQRDVRLMETDPQTRRITQTSSGDLYEEEELVLEEEEGEGEGEDIPELYLLSDEDLVSDGSGKSVDYGFIAAVTCLVTGISLVAISYTVPRDVGVDPDSVSAREMERLEREKARVGNHLDGCVMVGLCLLTLGGVLLSTMLMISLWKGEMMRRKAFAYSKHAKLYGSINLEASASGSTWESCSHLSSCDEDFEIR